MTRNDFNNLPIEAAVTVKSGKTYRVVNVAYRYQTKAEYEAKLAAGDPDVSHGWSESPDGIVPPYFRQWQINAAFPAGRFYGPVTRLKAENCTAVAAPEPPPVPPAPKAKRVSAIVRRDRAVIANRINAADAAMRAEAEAAGLPDWTPDPAEAAKAAGVDLDYAAAISAAEAREAEAEATRLADTAWSAAMSCAGYAAVTAEPSANDADRAAHAAAKVRRDLAESAAADAADLAAVIKAEAERMRVLANAGKAGTAQACRAATPAVPAVRWTPDGLGQDAGEILARLTPCGCA